MTKVFIGGSRKISWLSPAVRERLGRIVVKRLPVVIGDANGGDKAVQAYLLQEGYDIRASHNQRDFDYYATKDRQMAREASVGLMLWDGESRGLS